MGFRADKTQHRMGGALVVVCLAVGMVLVPASALATKGFPTVGWVHLKLSRAVSARVTVPLNACIDFTRSHLLDVSGRGIYDGSPIIVNLAAAPFHGAGHYRFTTRSVMAKPLTRPRSSFALTGAQRKRFLVLIPTSRTSTIIVSSLSGGRLDLNMQNGGPEYPGGPIRPVSVTGSWHCDKVVFRSY